MLRRLLPAAAYDGCVAIYSRVAASFNLNRMEWLSGTSRCELVFALVGMVCCQSVCLSADPVADPGAQLSYSKDVLPLFVKYCGGCHRWENAEAGIAFDKLKEELASTRDRSNWQKIHTQVANRIMPPPDETQPSEAERQTIIDWIKSHALAVQCTGDEFPGRVTIHRLNRAEYNATIRDLLGVDFQPAENFPADDTGYGFDNIGDVLTLPPVLFERYLEAAEQVTRRAILAPDADFASEILQSGGVLASTGEVSKEFDFPVSATYLLRIRAYANQAGPDLAKMSFKLDGKNLATHTVRAKDAGETETFEQKIRVLKGAHTLAGGFLNDYYKQGDGKAEDRNLHIVSLGIVGPIGELPITLPESHRKIMIANPKSPKENASASRTILAKMVPKIWRRPVSEAEIKPLSAIVTRVTADGGSFERGIQTALQAALVSPRFLFRIERDPEPEAKHGIRALDDYELASRLSFFLWSSTPDDELLEAARLKKLTQPKELERQVRRMLADARSRSIVDNFASQWLQLRSLQNVSPDPKRFPQFTKELRQDMRRETEMLFETIVKEDRSILEFLEADYTFVNERLAKHYGIEGVQGDNLQRVSINVDQRGGLLGQASILTVTSNPGRTSPVKRGKWILENLLASPPPPAPPGVPPLPEESRDTPATLTLKERMAQHRADPACAACHQLMDPLGFGMENYDAIGAWRTADGKADIDASGELADGRKFTGPKELRSILLERADDFRRCLTERLMTYALGRGLEYFDVCAVRKIVDLSRDNGDHFSSYVLGIVQSNAFRQRASTTLPE